MSTIENLILSNTPFGSRTKNIKKIISDFLTIESKEENNSYSYQYLNCDYFSDIAFAICLNIAEKNISAKSRLEIADLKIGDILQYENKNYSWQGIDKENLDHGKLQDCKDRTLTRSILVNSILNSSVPVRQEKSKSVSAAREALSKYFGLKEFSKLNSKPAIVIAEKKIIRNLENSQIELNDNQRFSFDAICSGNYLTDGMDVTSLTGMVNKEKNTMILFSSSARAVAQYLEEQDKIVQKDIYVIGDKWLHSNILDLINLRSLCDEFSLNLKVFSSVGSAIDKVAIDFIKQNKFEFPWLDPMEELNSYNFNYHFVTTNSYFVSTMKEIQSFLDEINQDQRLLYLKSKILHFLKLTYNQVSGESQLLEAFMNDILDYAVGKDFNDIERLKDLLKTIVTNRFGYNMQKKINQIRDPKKNCIILVTSEMCRDAEKIFQNDTSVFVEAIESDIGEDLYDKYQQMILISPNAKNRNKWLTSYACRNIDVIFAENQKKYQYYYLEKDKRLVKELYTLSQTEVDSTNPYLKSITEFFNKKQIVNIEKDIEDIQNDYLNPEIYEKYGNNVNDSDDSDNALGDVVRKVNLISGKIILVTENAKVFIIDKDNYLRRIDYIDLQRNQKIIEFEIRECKISCVNNY